MGCFSTSANVKRSACNNTLSIPGIHRGNSTFSIPPRWNLRIEGVLRMKDINLVYLCCKIQEVVTDLLDPPS